MSTVVAKTVGDLEEAVLHVLWSSRAALSVREVMQRLQRKPQLAYTTVLTVLRRLYDKGLLARAKDGKAYVYRPVVSQEGWMGQRAARELVGRRAGAPTQAVLMAFLESAEQADPELVARLSALIDARKRGGGSPEEGGS